MQIGDAPHSLSAPLYALIGAAIMACINYIFNRGKNKADTNLSNALARKADIDSSATAVNTISNALVEIRNLKNELSEANNKLTVSEFKREEAEKRVEELERILKNSGNGKVRD